MPRGRVRPFRCYLQYIHASRNPRRAFQLRRLAKSAAAAGVVATALSLWRRTHFRTWRPIFAAGARETSCFGGPKSTIRDTRGGSERFCFEVQILRFWTCGSLAVFVAGKALCELQSTDFAAGAANLEVQISWQAQRFEPPSADFVAGEALSEPRSADFVAGTALCEPQSAYFVASIALCEPRSANFVAGPALCEPRSAVRGRRSTMSLCKAQSADFVAGTALRAFVNLHVQILWQAQHFVNLEAQMSRQARHFVNLEVQIPWQAQRFVNLEVQISWRPQRSVSQTRTSCSHTRTRIHTHSLALTLTHSQSLSLSHSLTLSLTRTLTLTLTLH